MNSLQSQFPRYHNAMEPLVAYEIEQQLQQLPADVASSIEPSQAIAYALNRLPPLYATTPTGWEWQQERARETLQSMINKAVAWGVRAAQRQPRRVSAVTQTPLDPGTEWMTW